MGTVPWWQDPSIRLALATVLVPGLYQILVHLGVKMPLSEEHFTPVLVNALVVGGGVVWIIRRIKRGTNPADPAPKVTLTDQSKP
jgi:hypothetical protein